MSTPALAHSQRAAAAWSLLGAGAAAIMAVCVNHASRVVDFRTVLLARSIAVLLVAWMIYRFTRVARPGALPRAIWLRSLVGACAVVANFYVVATLPVSDAIVLVNTSPLWVVIASWLWLGQRQRPSTWLAALVGWSGVLLVARPHFEDSPAGVLVGLSSGVMLAIVGLTISHLRSLPSALVVLHYAAASVVLALIVSLVPLPSGSAWAPIPPDPATLALLAGACAFAAVNQLAATRAYQMGRTSRVAVVGLSQLVIVFAIDHAVEPRVVDPLSLLGLLLVAGPTAYMMLSKRESRHVLLLPMRVDRHVIEPSDLAEVEHARVQARLVTGCRIDIEFGGPDDPPSAEAALVRFRVRRLGDARRRDDVFVWASPATGRIVVVADEGVGDVIPRRAIARCFRDCTLARSSSATVAASIVALAGILAGPFPATDSDVADP